jgi:hypothetical protein
MQRENPTRSSTRRMIVGATLGFAFGLFVNVPWGAFARPDAPGLLSALPATLGFTLPRRLGGFRVRAWLISHRADAVVPDRPGGPSVEFAVA